MLGFLNRSNSSDTSSLKSKPAPAATNGVPQLNRPVSSQKRDTLSALTSPNARPVTPSRTVSGMSTGKRLTKAFPSFTGRFGGSKIKDEHATVRQRCQQELGSHVEASAFDTSFGGLLEWIRTERLTRVPHKGGHWDRVLIKVQHFAEQVYHLTNAIDGFTDDCAAASHLMYGHCLLLLELGHENAAALEKAFHLFYRFGLELLPLLRCVDLFAASSTISESVSNVFSDLLNIVTAVAITFYRAVHNGRESTTIDVYRAFGSQIEMYHSHVTRTTYAIWGYCLNGDDDINRQRLETLQKQLSSQDTILSFLAAKRINMACQPEQFTCTWFQSHLVSFIRSEKRILLVEGKTGSGKTTLANWTLDRLQRTVNRKSLTTISFFFNPNIDSLDSSLELVKILLQQLLFQRIGDVHLFNALNEVLTESLLLQNAEEQENKLWVAMSKGLQHLNDLEDDSLVIVVDGLDLIHGQELPAQKVSQKLYDLVNRISSIRLIQFAQPLKTHPKNSINLHLTSEVLFNDMSTIARRQLMLHPHFKSMNDVEQERAIDPLVQAAGTSILWLSLACKFILQQHQSFDKSLEVMLSSSANIADTVHKLISSSHLDQDSKNTLSYVLTARRPLLFDEIKLLLQAQPDRFSMIPRTIELDAIMRVIAPFVLQTEGLVGVRHNSIKQALVAEQSTSKWLIQAQERHKDLLLRVLTYANTCLVEDRQATLEPLASHHVDIKLRGHTLLEYAIRYWAIHFQKTVHYKSSGSLTLPKDFKSIFPSSVVVSMLEESCWLEQLTPLEVLPLLITAYRVRETMYGSEKACVLQTALAIARIYEKILSRTSDAVEWYFKAMKICYKVLGAHVEMTLILCQMILRLSEKHVVAKRSSIMEWREEVMLTLITIYTQRFGSSSKEVIEIREMLIELYILIHEEHKCEEHRKLIEIVIHGRGRGGLSFESNLELEGSLTLKKHREKEKFDNFEGGFLGGYIAEGKEILFTFEMIEQIIIRISVHIKAGHIEKAEELYIELWLKLTEYCQIHREVEWHAKKLEIMIAYSRFLHTHHRSSEASTILLCIWREYEHHEVSSFELINILLKEVAVFMKVFGLFTTSLAVFKKCWSYFKYAHKEHTEIYKEIETNITIISTEIVKTSMTSITSETIIREVFESSMSSSETITTTTIELCRSLTSTYIKKEKYSEAIICIERALRRSWASFFFESDVSITISTQFTSENIELVMKLAECYLHQKRYEKVEEIYIRLYRVYRRIHSVKHKLVITYIEKILTFYRERGFFMKAISFYQELLVDYRIVYGAADFTTIDILYSLGDLCRQHYLTHGYWIEYYLEIVTVLNKGRTICHEKALRALIIVAEHHYEALRYSEALVYFNLIFSTFKECGSSYKYFENLTEVQTLIEHYFRTIEESQIDIEIHISIIKELRESCLKYYKESHVIIHMVSLVLASVCLRSEKYEFEAISLYEYITKTSTTVTKEVRSALRQLYYKRTTTSTTVTKEEIETTVTMTYEHYISIREEYTCIHEETLSVLRELIILWHKLGKSELIIKELRSAILEIITTVKKSEVFVETGKFLAEIFILCELQSFAYEFVHELRRQIIYKVVTVKEFNIIKVDRSCLAFIAAFEYYVRADWSVTLSVLMADLIAEYSYYWRFCESIKIKASIETIFVHGGRLRRILVRTNRLIDFAIVEEKLIEYFISQEGEVMKNCQQSAVKLFIVLILKYCSSNQLSKTFTATAGHAAISEITALLKMNKQKEAVELTRCTFYYLMAHEGLDDPTEITMGFRLSLLMGGRITGHKPNVNMLELSRTILAAVFTICENFEINIARIQLSELNQLIEMIGDQKDYVRLHWLLRYLWTSRESQTKWPKDAVVKLGMRLVQAEFAAGHTTSAIRLCEDIVYNIRRVHGPRHQNTLRVCELLASLYTSIGMRHKSGSEKRDQELSKFYFKKALAVHEDALKAFVGWDESDQDDDDDDDLYSEYTGSVVQGHESKYGNGHGHVTFNTEREEVEAAVRHVRKLHLAMLRLGGWTKPAGDFERLTEGIWKIYGSDLKLKEDEVKSGQWKVEKLGDDVRFDCFDVPPSWGVVTVPVEG